MNTDKHRYRTQSRDTSLEIDKFLMLAFREMPAWKKAHLINEAIKGIQQWALIGIRNQHPNATLTEVRFQLAVRWLGKEIANQLYLGSEGKIVDAYSIKLALRMAEIFDALAVAYIKSKNSVASDVHVSPNQ